MAFTVKEFRDLLGLLATHPEWRQELLRALLTDDLLTMPEVLRDLAEAQRRTEDTLEKLAQRMDALAEAQRRTEERVEELAQAQRRTEERLEALARRVDDLAEAQRRTEERLEALAQRVDELAEAQRRTEERVEELAQAQRRTEERLEALARRVDDLAEAQRRTEERLEALAQRVDELAEAQRRTEERVEELAQAQRRTEERLEALTRRVEDLAEAQQRTETQVQRLTDRVAKLDGRMLEMDYHRKASSYFGRLVKRAQVIDVNDLEDLLVSKVPFDQIEDITRLDLVVRGQLRPIFNWKTDQEVWLAVEISVMIDRQDVERVLRRTKRIKSAGLAVLPVVAGENITAGARELVEREAVVLLTDGAMTYAEDAVERYLVDSEK